MAKYALASGIKVSGSVLQQLRELLGEDIVDSAEPVTAEKPTPS